MSNSINPQQQTSYRLPKAKIEWLAGLPARHQAAEIFDKDCMEQNNHLVAGESEEFQMGFASGLDFAIASLSNFLELSYTADVPVRYFEKILFAVLVATAQEYVKNDKPEEKGLTNT